MTKTILFMRHVMTPAQALWLDAPYESDPAAQGTIVTGDDALAIVRGWLKDAPRDGGVKVFGVFPAIVRATLFSLNVALDGHTVRVVTYEWHNTQRAAECAAPTAATLGGDGWLVTNVYDVLAET